MAQLLPRSEQEFEEIPSIARMEQKFVFQWSDNRIQAKPQTVVSHVLDNDDWMNKYLMHQFPPLIRPHVVHQSPARAHRAIKTQLIDM